MKLMRWSPSRLVTSAPPPLLASSISSPVVDIHVEPVRPPARRLATHRGTATAATEAEVRHGVGVYRLSPEAPMSGSLNFEPIEPI